MTQTIAAALGDLSSELVFIGGCAVGMLITDPARPPSRATLDVDLVSEVTTLVEYYKLGERLKAAGFQEFSGAGAYTCRWKYGSLIVDVMPQTDALGFTNIWYAEAIRSATEVAMPNGAAIRIVSAPLMLATKLEAFAGRGNGDYIASRDIEDIISVVDGRAELLDEIRQAPNDVQNYLREEFDLLLADDYFFDAISGHLHPDAASQARRELVVERLRAIAGL